MTMDPHRAVRDRQPVTAHYRNASELHARGRIVAYCETATFIIEEPDGTRFSWRADLVTPIDANELPIAPQPSPPPPLLTKTEIDVLYLVADGLTSPEIAQVMYLTVHTVRSHLHRIAKKLGTNNRLSSVLAAHHRGYIQIAKLNAA